MRIIWLELMKGSRKALNCRSDIGKRDRMEQMEINISEILKRESWSSLAFTISQVYDSVSLWIIDRQSTFVWSHPFCYGEL
jgi:hypothetical protein